MDPVRVPASLALSVCSVVRYAGERIGLSI